MDSSTKSLFEESVKGLQDSFHSLWSEGAELSKKLTNINERVNELSATTVQANKEVNAVNKLSAFKEYDRQIVELTRKIEKLEKENTKLKEPKEPEKPKEPKEPEKPKEPDEPKEPGKPKEDYKLKEDEYNSGGEQPPPDMPDSEEEDEEDMEGEEFEHKGEQYWLVKDDEENFMYKFVGEDEIEEMPCGQLKNKKVVLF